MENVNIYTFDSCYFPVSCPILPNLHILACLIESFRMVYGLWGCVEMKNVDPSRSPRLKIVNGKCQFLHFGRLLFSSLTSYPGEIAYFSSPNQQLSNFVRLMEPYWNKNVDPSRSPCLKIISGKRFERRNFLVLRPVLLRIAYFSSANGELSKGVRLLVLR